MRSKIKYCSGFTFLELLAVIAIIAIASIFAMPAFQNWNAKRSYDRSFNEVYSALSDARLNALSLSTTIKIIASASGDTYTFTTYSNTDQNALCTATANWNQLSAKTVSINSNFQITGTGIGNVCFFRDGTATGGLYNITQKNGGTNLGSGSINVILATGFIDVTKN